MSVSNIMDYLKITDETIKLYANKVISLVFIVVVMFLVVKLGSATIDKFVKKQNKLKFSFDSRKAKTIGEVLKSILKYLVYFFGIISILELFLGTITVTFASIGGVAVGFAAQNIIKDIINGFLILFEDQFSVGDYVDIEGKSGAVESIQLRITKIRDFNGDLHIIPNGQIIKLTNHSRGNMRFTLEVSFSSKEDISRVMELVKRACEAVTMKNEFITEPPIILGLSSIVDNLCTLKVSGMAKPTKQGQCEMELRSEIKAIFDSNNIEVSPKKQVIIKNEN